MTEEERRQIRLETFAEITAFLRASEREGTAAYLEYCLLTREERQAKWEGR